MKKLVAILLLCLFALLLIAARPRPRPCGTRTQCFNLLFPVATMTPTLTRTKAPNLPIRNEDNSTIPFQLIALTDIPLYDCGGYAAHNCMGTPPLPATAPPAGYP